MYGITGIVGNDKKYLTKSIKKISGRGRAYVVQNLSADKYIALSFTKTNKTPQPVHFFIDECSGDFCLFYGILYDKSTIYKFLETSAISDDAELIMKLYKKIGAKFIKHLDGSFVIVLGTKGKLSLISDYFGTKTLYYSAPPNDYFVFSSSLQSILRYVKKAKISERALASYLQYRFVAHPLTIFENIYKISPKQIIQIGNKIIKKQYTKDVVSSKSLKDWAQIVADCHSDKTGLLLSGGLDSSILASLTEPVKAFTISYETQHSDTDLSCAKLVAAKFSHKHNVVKMKSRDILSALNSSICQLEEPMYSTISASSNFLANKAKKSVSTMITGDGADELFIGYNYIRTALNSQNNEIEEYKKQISWCDELLCKQLLGKNIKHIDLIKDTTAHLDSILDFEQNYRLPNYHLSRLEKIMAANNIIACTPFLSEQMLNYVSAFTNKTLYTTPPKKHLSQPFVDVLPVEITTRQKQPFPAPFITWIDTCLQKDIIKTFSNKKLTCKLGINHRHLLDLAYKQEKQYHDYTTIWGFYMLLLWVKKFYKHIV